MRVIPVSTKISTGQYDAHVVVGETNPDGSIVRITAVHYVGQFNARWRAKAEARREARRMTWRS